MTQIRREPPRFRRVEVRRTREVSPRLVGVTLGGDELAGFELTEPAASVRVLLATRGESEPEIPTWNGNEFLRADGRRPTIRTFTPRRFDAAARELDVEVVVHEEGAASDWATHARPGDRVAVSGPGRGYPVDPAGTAWTLAGDETAIPAIAQLLEHLPAAATLSVHVEIATPQARLALPEHPGAVVEWHEAVAGAPPGSALVAALDAHPIADDEQVWVAGEAAAVQRIRRRLFEERGVPRSRTTIRGYWKHGRAGT